MQSMPLNEDDAIIEANGNVQIKDNEIFVMQGYYRNPGVQQSRSARFGPGLRSEEAAMGIVLAWMEFQHSQAAARRVAEFLSSNECFMFVVITEWKGVGLAVWLPVTCAYSFQSAFHVQNVWQQCDQLRNDESDSEDLSETEMPCLNDGCSDLNQKQLKRKKGMQTKAKIDSISDIADPEKEAKKRKVMEEMPDKKGCFKDSSGDKIKAKKEKKKKRQREIG